MKDQDRIQGVASPDGGTSSPIANPQSDAVVSGESAPVDTGEQTGAHGKVDRKWHAAGGHSLWVRCGHCLGTGLAEYADQLVGHGPPCRQCGGVGELEVQP